MEGSPPSRGVISADCRGGEGRLDGLRCTLADIPRLVLSLHIIDSSFCVFVCIGIDDDDIIDLKCDPYRRVNSLC